jgi:hypothetical protein
MENKTAMMQMLEWIRKTLPMDLDTPRMIEEKIESLLKVEKEQIGRAYQEGLIDGMNHSPKDYYNKNYKQQNNGK